MCFSWFVRIKSTDKLYNAKLADFESEGLYNVFWCVTIPSNVKVKDLAVQMLLSNENDESQHKDFNETWSSELNTSPWKMVRLMPREPIWIDKGRHLTSILTMELKDDKSDENNLEDGGLDANNSDVDLDENESQDKLEDNNKAARDKNSGVVHYFELVPYLSGSCNLPDVFILGFPLDTSLSLIPPCIQLASAPGRIVALDVSFDQRYAVSLSVNSKDLTVDVWDLRPKEDASRTKVPVASAKIPAVESNSFDLSIAISSDGSHIAVFEEPKDVDEWKGGNSIKPGIFEAHFFEHDPTFTPGDGTVGNRKSDVTEKIPSASSDIRHLKLLECERESSLKTFSGFAKFQHRSPGIIVPSQSQGHVFVACNGFDISVFELSSMVKFRYSILLPTPSPINALQSTQLDRRDACQHLINTLQDSRFVWNGDEGKVQVWNWRNGNHIATLDGSDKTLNSLHRIILSKDGSAVIVASKKNIAVYSAESGLPLSKIDIGMSELRLFECFDSDRVMAAGWIEDNDGDGEPNQVFRIMDLYCLSNVINVAQIQLPISDTISYHVMPSTAGDRGNIATIVQHNLAEIQLVDLKPRESDPQPDCSPRCDKENTKSEIRESVDKELGCKYTLSRDDRQRSFHLYRTTEKDEKKDDILAEEPSRDDQKIRWLTFLPCGKRFLVIRMKGFALWQLPNEKLTTCKLLIVKARNRKEHGIWTMCPHGLVMRWKPSETEEVEYVDISRKIFFGSEETLGLVRAMPIIIQCFELSEDLYKQAVIELLKKHINRHPEIPETIGPSPKQSKPFKRSIIGAIIKGCSDLGAELLLHALLESTEFGHWIPHTIEFSEDASKDVIGHLVKESKESMLKMVVDYLLARAHSNSPYYITLLSISIPHLFPKYPELALHISRRSAFIPVKDSESLIHEAVINVPQWRFKPHFIHKDGAERKKEGRGRLYFWAHRKTQLYEFMDQNPVFQLNSQLPITTTTSNNIKNTEAKKVPVGETRQIRNREIKIKFYTIPFSLIWRTRRTDPTKEGAWMFLTTAWVRKAVRLIWHFVFPFDTLWVRTHYSDLEAFDNPAIEALIEYKWTRFAWLFWVARLGLQVTYELLVLAVTFLQIYGQDSRGQELAMKVGFISITVLGYILLHLEFQQMRGGLKRYLSSPYNYIDLCVFELRIIKAVCEVVTVVVNILLRIPAFFAILAVFIFAFAHSINHVIEVDFRNSDVESQADTGLISRTIRDEFPRGYLQSVSSTYFFMTGTYDPVRTSMVEGHWTIQLMVGIYFFLTAVLMMNVVIALMNGVYSEAVEAGKRIWLKNRLDAIAGAENLTFYMPNYRHTRDFFPQYIYYPATERQIQDYRKKFELDIQPLKFDFSVPKILASPAPQNDDQSAAVATMAMQEELKKSIAKLQERITQEQKEWEERILLANEKSEARIKDILDKIMKKLA
ncbi:hypothetical protein BGX27_011179 [Mortierella sp. AM989]|nr:hypothetical protein BGX27_011179 [Mortierella sp. AM989]